MWHRKPLANPLLNSKKLNYITSTHFPSSSSGGAAWRFSATLFLIISISLTRSEILCLRTSISPSLLVFELFRDWISPSCVLNCSSLLASTCFVFPCSCSVWVNLAFSSSSCREVVSECFYKITQSERTQWIPDILIVTLCMHELNSGCQRRHCKLTVYLGLFMSISIV